MKALHGLTLAIALMSTCAASASVNVMGFQAWKTARIDEARQALERVQSDKGVSEERVSNRKAEAKSPRLQSALKNGRVDQKLQQATTNLDIAKEFTVNDYFVLYLSQFKQRDAFLEAAKKLNPDEAADLMIAYQRYLLGANPSESVDTVSRLDSGASGSKSVTN